MLLNQPLATRFGFELSAALESGEWTQLDIAVAWIRASGLAHLSPSLSAFLAAGGSLSTVVGIDLDNTSSDGLRALVALGEGKDAEAFVYHNESATIFHPKLYLLRNSASARLIIGSNNITEAGLYKNTELALQLDLELDDPLVASILDALGAWQDVSSGLAHRLDETVIQALEDNGYIKSEAAIRGQHAARRAQSRGANSTLKKLFKSIHVSAPPVPGTHTANASANAAPGVAKKRANKATGVATAPTLQAAATGRVLLMRIRKAHTTDRPTQTQIPAAVLNSTFFSGAMSVVSAHSGELHAVSVARARGSTNTLKLEIPEMRNMADPVVRFDHTNTGIQYEVYDASSPQGKVVMTALQNGLAPGVANRTKLTRPKEPGRSTWWRFV